MKITPECLTLLQTIEHYFFFKMKMNEERSVASLAAPENLEAFIAYVKMFEHDGRGFIGGFRISFTDESLTRIIKRPHSFMDPSKKFEDGEYVIDVERYQKNPANNLPYTIIDKFKPVLNYGRKK